MSLLQLLRHRIRAGFGPDSLLGRVSLVFVTAVTVPTIALIALLFTQAQTVARQDAISSSRRIHTELRARLNDETVRFQSVASELSFNSRIRTFLDREFRLVAEDVLLYRQSIYPLLNLAAQIVESPWNAVSVYETNATVPEAWPYVFGAWRVDQESWYARIRDDGVEQVWIYPYDARVRSDFLVSSRTKPVFAVARRIGAIASDKFLGVSLVMVPEERIFSAFDSFATETMQFTILDAAGQPVFTTSAAAGEPRDRWQDEVVSDLTTETAGYREITRNGVFYRAARISLLDGWMVSSTDLNASAFATNVWAWSGYLVLIVAIGLMQVFTYRFLSRLLKRLGHVTRTMHAAAEGDLAQRVLDERRDEIGQLGRDFNYMIARIRELMDETVERETAQKNAQLQALQYQINPHFIHNTLDIFRMRLAIEGNDRVADSLASFGSILRYNLSGDPEVRVKDEVAHVREYLEIQRLRFEDRVTLNVQISNELLNTCILKFVLQPLVENAITHGFGDECENLTIRLRAHRDAGAVILLVEDDGLGICAERLQAIRSVLAVRGAEPSSPSGVDDSSLVSRRLGLANIDRRLHLHYGGNAGLLIESEGGVGTTVTVVIPETW